MKRKNKISQIAISRPLLNQKPRVATNTQRHYIRKLSAGEKSPFFKFNPDLVGFKYFHVKNEEYD